MKKKPIGSTAKVAIVLVLFFILLGTLVVLNRNKIPVNTVGESSASAVPEKTERVVLTTLAPLHYLTSELADGTNIRVTHLFPDGLRMNDMGRWFKENAESFETTARNADAVITLGNTNVCPIR
jgi:hypothetical protein